MKRILVLFFILRLAVGYSQTTIVGHVFAEVVESVVIDSVFISRLNFYTGDITNTTTEPVNYFVMRKIDSGKLTVDLIMD
jgi:hypothetical protein